MEDTPIMQKMYDSFDWLKTITKKDRHLNKAAVNFANMFYMLFSDL